MHEPLPEQAPDTRADAPPQARTLPYPYQPPAQAMIGPAFGPAFKLLTWTILLALAVWIARLDFDWRSSQGAWVAVAWAMLAFIAWHIQRSRVRIDSQMVEQSWMWRKEMGLQDLLLVQILRVPGLDWLIAPRVYVRNMTGKFAFFYCSDPALLAELQRLSQTLVQSRRL